jgi:hypothetical protein
MSESEPLMRCRKVKDDVKTGGFVDTRISSGGDLPTAWMVERGLRYEVAKEMEGGPPKPPCRRRLQTTSSCCGQKLW